MEKLLRKNIVAAVLLVSSLGQARDEAFTVKANGKDGETVDRIVDRAAVQIQIEAIGRIEKMMKHPRVGARKADLTFQLGMAYMEAASLYFRIGHEESARKGKKVDLSNHHRMMEKSIKTFDGFLKEYADSEYVPQALFMRGTAHDEIEKKKLAERDFLELVKRFPDVRESSPAHMKLAEYATEEKDHARAINHLRVIEGRPEDLHFPFALYKLAWSNYNLKNFAVGLDYLRRHIAFYNKRIKDEEQQGETSDVAIRDNSMKDIAVFFFEGFSQRADGFALSDALRSFEKHASGNSSNSIVVRFTALLRTRAQDAELEEWSQKLMKSDLPNDTMLAALGIVFENQVNRRLFNLMPKTMERIMTVVNRDRRKLLKSSEIVHIKAQLEEGTAFLHKAIAENKKNARVHELTEPLAGLYNDLIIMADERDPSIVKAYFNLAETYFDLKQYEKATLHYRIIVDKYPKLDKTMETSRVMLLAISSRYEELKNAKIIPETLEAKGVHQDKPEASLPKPFEDWVAWIKDYKSEARKVDSVIEKYEFESIRVRYSKGRIVESVDDLIAVLRSKKQLTADDAPAVLLVLDSYILSKDWEHLSAVAEKLSPLTQDAKLLARFRELKTDSLIKLAESDYEKKDLSGALRRAEKCISQKDEVQEKKWLCEFMQAKIQLEKNGFDKALPFLSKIIDKSNDKKLVAGAISLRAQGYVAKSEFEKAIPDLLKVVEDEGSKGAEEKIYRAVLMTNNPGLYAKVSQHPKYCEGAPKQCLILSLLVDARNGKSSKKLDINDVQRADRDVRALMALVALPENMKSFQDTRKILGEIGDNWSKMDPQVSLQIASQVVPASRPAFAQMRAQLKHYFRVSDDPASVKLRIDRLKNYEQAAESLSRGLSWKHVHVALLKDVALAYQDFAAEVPVEEFRAPLIQKAAQLEAEQSSALAELKTSELLKLNADLYKKEFSDLSDTENSFLGAIRNQNPQAASFYLAKLMKDSNLEEKRKPLLEALLLDSVGARYEALARYNTFMGSKVVAQRSDD